MRMTVLFFAGLSWENFFRHILWPRPIFLIMINLLSCLVRVWILMLDWWLKEYLVFMKSLHFRSLFGFSCNGWKATKGFCFLHELQFRVEKKLLACGNKHFHVGVKRFWLRRLLWHFRHTRWVFSDYHRVFVMVFHGNSVFWWHSTEQEPCIHWMGWWRLSKSKKSSGLGFRDVSCFISPCWLSRGGDFYYVMICLFRGCYGLAVIAVLIC